MVAVVLEGASTREVFWAALAVMAGAAAFGYVLSLILRRLVRRLGIAVLDGSLWRSPVIVITVLASMYAFNSLVARAWTVQIALVLKIALILAVAWLLVVLAYMVEKAALAKFPRTSIEDLRSRHARTQISLLRRVAVSLIVGIALASVLWTFPVMRELGTALLASAGVLGIIAGLAAQTTLGNVFAGLQIAFTDGIRVGDIVVIENEWGHIETVTLTYVVVRVANGTCLIVPSTYFTTTPFRNWSHAGSQVTGQVDVVADWDVPVQDVREELLRTVRNSRHWDGQLVELVVEAIEGSRVLLSAHVSAQQGDSVRALCWEVREALLVFLQRHPAGVPRLRTESVTTPHDGRQEQP